MEQVMFGFYLKQRRKTLDLTQEELAVQVGCAAETIRKLEAGGRRPSKEIAQCLADALHIAAEERQAFLQFARQGRPAGQRGTASGSCNRRKAGAAAAAPAS